MTSKTGRNDPCPCGSGKKYKKCCYEKGLKARKWNALKSQSDGIVSKGLFNVASVLDTLKGQLDQVKGGIQSKKTHKIEEEIKELSQELEHAGPDTHDEIKARLQAKMDEGLKVGQELAEKKSEKEVKKRIIRKKQ